MSAAAGSKSSHTYKNPVYDRSFPDPFVLKHGRDYFAYCTGIHEDGNVFGVLRSRDLVEWQEVGGAMRRLETDAPYYWAPEVTHHEGKFYLYYSVGNEILMEIRLAISDRPDGGFEDIGKRLTFEEFAIDPHVFIDDDGQKYLFYATDFLEHTHIGTGTVVDRMLDWDRLEGKPRPVTRAKYDWQVYDPARKEKGGVRWHTVEGPFVLKRKGRYFEMFSGGNWQNVTYGVSFASSEKLLTEAEWEQFSDGDTALPVLRTIPGKIIGPGHNSVVVGPNGRELFCVYHRWTDAGRVMAIDRMDFAGDRIFVIGPTDTPQPAPFPPSDGPSIDERFEAPVDLAATGWNIAGTTRFSNGELFLEAATAAASFGRKLQKGQFELAANIRLVSEDATGDFGLRLFGTSGAECVFQYSVRTGLLSITVSGSDLATPAAPSEFRLARQLRILNYDESLYFYLDGSHLLTREHDLEFESFEVFCADAAVALDMVRFTSI